MALAYRKIRISCTALGLSLIMLACTSTVNKKAQDMKNGYVKGTYGYDVGFFTDNNIKTIELKNEDAKARVLLVPGYQGRVMTSSANGNEGISFGWVNHNLIASGEINSRFNPFGGEERFWLGPEGGPFSIYFEEGEEQVHANWNVPPSLDTESYDIKSQEKGSVTFGKNAVFKNASGTEFNVGVERRVSLLSRNDLCSLFDLEMPVGSIDVVAYKSDNTITNTGNNSWTKEKGLVSIWMLGMFNPSPTTTVFIPYKTEGDGKVVNDDYFGKLSSDRLIVDNGTVFFRIDGKQRSKIGIPPLRAKELCGSYDSEGKILTVLWCSLPCEAKDYVNSKWGEQDNPYEGDVINSYNDGPLEDGSIMGPFYEIETSSPGAELEPGGSLTHTQVVMHIQGDEAGLAKIVNKLFHVNLYTVTSKFQ